MFQGLTRMLHLVRMEGFGRLFLVWRYWKRVGGCLIVTHFSRLRRDQCNSCLRQAGAPPPAVGSL